MSVIKIGDLVQYGIFVDFNFKFVVEGCGIATLYISQRVLLVLSRDHEEDHQTAKFNPLSYNTNNISQVH